MIASCTSTLEKIRKAKEELFERARYCHLCPRGCGVDRLTGATGYCKASKRPRVAAACIHRGEEPPISGSKGSGTIFFSHCNLRCVFCQNYQISHLGRGKEWTPENLASCMMGLQRRGVHNLNFVSPTHYLPWIIEALELAYAKGFCLPIVYNTNGYESEEVLRSLADIVDIYLPDIKYADALLAHRLSEARNYPRIVQRSVRMMYDQVGNLLVDDSGIAQKGLLARHLVLPGYLENSKSVLDFLTTISAELTVSLMGQYYPCHRAKEYPPLNSVLSVQEYNVIMDHAIERGLDNTFIQELESAEHYLPQFDNDHPFEDSASF